ncbi:MAG: DUF3467 domain-containing protein [Anaerolineaceae bacterium]|jgi:hypothetical protein
MENQKEDFYANAAFITTSIYDITFVFKSQTPQIDSAGKMILKDGQPVFEINEEIYIRMSPQHAKALSSLLVKNIIEYEKQFAIQLPLVPEIQMLWDENIK